MTAPPDDRPRLPLRESTFKISDHFADRPTTTHTFTAGSPELRVTFLFRKRRLHWHAYVGTGTFDWPSMSMTEGEQATSC